VERAKKYAPYAVAIAAILIQFRAPLLGKIWFFEDIQAYFHPLWTAAARAMRHGWLPTWDLGAWSGQPLTGDPQIGIFYPPNWLWLAMHPLRAYAWLMLFHALVAAAGMAALLVARGRSHSASALGGLALALSAFMVLELRHIMFVATTAWLPWVLWGIEKYSQDRRLDRLVASAGALGLAVLAGGWSMLYWGALLVVVYSLLITASSLRSWRALPVIFAVGLSLAAVQIFPALAHARLSPRALGLEYSEAVSYSWPSWRYLVTLAFPTWYGTGDAYRGAPDQWELCGYSAGAIALVLAAISLFGRERRRERVALVALLGFALLVARGGGVHRFLFDHAPLFGSMRCPARALYLWTLIVPILAADGFDLVFSKHKTGTWRALAVAAVALELLIIWRAENPSVRLDAALPRPPALDWIRHHARSGRMVNDVHLGQRWHNIGLLAGSEAAGGYSSLPIWRYLHLLWIANHGAVYPHAHLANDLTAQGLWRFSSPLVDLLGVSHLMTQKPPDGSGWMRVFAGPDGIDVWRNSEALPRAFVVYETRVFAGDDAQARALADLRPWEEAIVDRELGVHGGGPMSPMAALFRDSPLDLAIEVDAQRRGVLVFGEVWAPGWKVLVDEKPAELLRVDYALRGVLLEPGRHTVAMALEDNPLAYGAAVSLTALALLIGLSILARRRTRLTSIDNR
jgi:hypothetical protein